MNIHHFALVAEGAVIGKNVTIGPFTTIGNEVVIEDNVIIHENVTIKGDTTIGEGTEIYPNAAIGLPPQDLKYKGEKSRVIIGKNCKIRENVTIHCGTENGKMLTQVGDNCLLMVGTHVAHDCILGNNIVMANYTSLAGHVEIDDFCIIGGHSAILQFVRVGKYAMICGMTGVPSNVTPYGMIFGNRGYLCGLNIIGLKRKGFERKVIQEIKNIYQYIFYYKDLTFDKRVALAQDKVISLYGAEIINFIKNVDNPRNFCQPSEK